MRIKTIKASGLKGCKSFVHQLAGVTVFCGANATGKTTRIETIQLATAGNVPGLTYKPGTKASAKDIHDHLASADLLHTYFDTDTGASVTRDWRKIKDSVKLQEVFIGLPDGFSVAPVLHDQMVFLGLSAKERTKFLFRTLPEPSLDKVGPAVLVANIKNIKVAENTEATESVITELCAYVNKCWTDCEMDKVPFMTIQEWLSEFVENVRQRLNAAAATAKRMETTNAGLTQLKVDGASFAAAEQAKAAAGAVLDEAKRVLNECRSNYAHAKKALDDAKAAAATMVDETEVRRCIEVQNGVVEQNRHVTAPGTAPVAKLMPGPRPNNLAASDLFRSLKEKAYQANLDQQAAIREVKLIENEIEAAGHKTSCPTCAQNIMHLQAEVIKTLRQQLKSAQDKEVSLTFEFAIANGNLRAAQINLEDGEKAISAWDTAKAALDTENQSALNEHNANVNAYNAAQRAINDATAAIQRLQASLASNQAAVAAKDSLRALEVNLSELFEAGNRAKVAETNAGVDFMTADQKHLQAIADRATAQSQARALAEAAKARAEVEIVKQFAEFLNELMAKIIEQSVQPLLAACNRICDGILRHPLALVDGEIGMRNPAAASGFVSWKTFSGAERALTFAGLSVALSVGQPFKLVMIDEFGKLSADNKTKMFGRLLDLVRDGFIDQAIIVDPDTNFYRNVGDVKDFVCIEIVRD